MKKILTYCFLLLVISCSKDSGNIEDNGISNDPECGNTGNLSITTQEDVNNFNFTEVSGHLYIQGTLINDLSGLSELTYVGGISIKYTQLTSLSGLQNLTTLCTGELQILDNPFLVDLSALSNIGTQIKNLIIRRCNSLADLTGLNIADDAQRLEIWKTPVENLNAFSNIKNINELVLKDLPNLNSIEGIINLENVRGEFILKNLINLSSLVGFNNLNKFPKSMNFNNLGIENFQGLNGITSTKSLYISRLNNLQSLSGFDNLESINGHFSISICPNLVEFGNFPNLTTIFSSLSLYDLPSLVSLSGLSNLTSTRTIDFRFCPSLISLEGLNNLSLTNSTTESKLKLEYLENLQDISALSNITGDINRLGDFIHLTNLNSLKSLEGLNNINKVNELKLINLPSLNSLNGLNGINEIGSLRIENSSVSNLSGLNNLTSVHHFIVFNCDLIQNFDGTNLIGDVQAGISGSTLILVENNPLLNDFCGLTNYANGTPFLGVNTSGNAYNPTKEQIRSTTECSQ